MHVAPNRMKAMGATCALVLCWVVMMTAQGRQTTSESVRTSEGVLQLTLSLDKVSTDSAGRMFLSGKGGISAVRDGELIIYFSGDVAATGKGELTLATRTESRRFVLAPATRICGASGAAADRSALTPGMPVTVVVLAKSIDQATQITSGYISVGPVGLMGAGTPVHPKCGPNKARRRVQAH